MNARTIPRGPLQVCIFLFSPIAMSPGGLTEDSSGLLALPATSTTQQALRVGLKATQTKINAEKSEGQLLLPEEVRGGKVKFVHSSKKNSEN